LWMGVISFLIATFGMMLLQDESMRHWGALLILSGMVVGSLASRTLDERKPRDERSVFEQTRQQNFALSLPVIVRIAGVAIACLFSLGASVLYLMNPTETFGWAGGLWLCSIALLLGAVMPWGEFRLISTTDPDHAKWASPRWSIWEVAIFATLIMAAGMLRLWDLANVPHNIYGDEIANGLIASEHFLRGPSPPVFSTVWQTIDHPALWFWIIAKAFSVGGVTLAMLRLPAALLSTATVLPLYSVLRSTWGRTTAIVGTAVWAFSASNVHYSRVTISNIGTQFFWVLCFCLLLYGIRKGSALYWVAAGIAAGLSEYGYAGTRLLPFVLVGLLVYLLVIHRSHARHYLWRFALLTISYLAAFGPLLAHYVTHPNIYFGRGMSLLIWKNTPLSLEVLPKLWDTLWSSLCDNLLGIGARASQDFVYFAPLLFPAEAALVAIGMALLIWRWREPWSFLVLLAGWGVLITGGVLISYDAVPFFAHWTPAFPLFYVTLALPIAVWIEELHRRLPVRLTWLAPAALALILAGWAFLNISFYFRDYYADPAVLQLPEHREIQKRIEVITVHARYQASLGPNYVSCEVGESKTRNPGNPYTEFLASNHTNIYLPEPQTQLPLHDVSGKGLAFFFVPGNEHYRNLVSTHYPGGTEGQVRNRKGVILFFTYLVSPAPNLHREPHQ